MPTQGIKQIIEDQESDLRKKFATEHIIQRHGVEKARIKTIPSVASIITGPRRAGKSIFSALMAGGDSYAYVNFEDDRFSISTSLLQDVLEAIYELKGEPRWLIFDEIQNVPGWERFIARIISTRRVIISGSNAKLLSSELATALTGRHIDHVLLPFSFDEYLKYQKISVNSNLTSSIAQAKSSLERFLREGGFPLAQKLGFEFLSALYKDMLERDVILRYRLRKPVQIRLLAKYLVSNTGCEFTYRRLMPVAQISNPATISNYVHYLQNAYLIFEVSRFSFKLKEQANAPKKIYCIDTGLARAAGFSFSENWGRSMENAVATHILRQMHSTPFYEFYYWKDHQQREVDFVIKQKERVVQLIQVCRDLDKPNTIKRETDALVRASRELRCDSLLVITWDFEGAKKVDGKNILFLPLWKYLLGKN
ncbi:MAG: ATP-binding protein [Candidatus Micrarchaeota archaeon]